MDIDSLRAIGRELLLQVPPAKTDRDVIGIGAAGDKTYGIDKLAEDIVIGGLERAGEPLTIVSEEAGVKELRGGGKKVLVDPIDGSRNAVSGIPFYCTSMAVAAGDTIGDIEMAYVVNLINGDEFWAEKGKGAFLSGNRITTQKDEILYLVSYEAQSPRSDVARILPLLSESRKTRCFGSTALDLAYLSAGSISIFANPSPSRTFDFGGGWLLVKEAGGIFTDMNGNNIDKVEISLKRSVPLLVSGNKELHDKALELLTREG